MNPPAPIFLYGHRVAAVPWYEASAAGLEASRFIFLLCIVGSARGKAPRHHVTKRVRKHLVFCGIPVYPDPCSFTGLHLTCGNGSGTGAAFAFVLSPNQRETETGLTGA